MRKLAAAFVEVVLSACMIGVMHGMALGLAVILYAPSTILNSQATSPGQVEFVKAIIAFGGLGFGVLISSHEMGERFPIKNERDRLFLIIWASVGLLIFWSMAKLA